MQGSHIVVPKLFAHDRAYIFQNADNRTIFAIPYELDFTLIGTTDRDFVGNLDDVQISRGEIEYLCGAASEYLAKSIEPKDVVWTYSGVRPLYDDGASAAQEATRDYVLRVDGEGAEAPLINIFGGKITTYRKLSEAVVEKVENCLGKRDNWWTAGSVPPGGDFEPGDYEALVRHLNAAFPFLARVHAGRLVRSYGTKAWKVLGSAKAQECLGRNFGPTLFESEVAFLMDNECVDVR